MLFFNRNSPEDEMKKAKAAYEKVISLSTDTRDTRSMRSRMGLLCCAHVDKTFVAGAEQTALWQDKAALALANEQPMPEVDGCAAIHVRGDGCDLIPVTADNDTFRLFLYAQQVARFTEDGRDYVGAAIRPPATSKLRLIREDV